MELPDRPGWSEPPGFVELRRRLALRRPDLHASGVFVDVRAGLRWCDETGTEAGPARNYQWLLAMLGVAQLAMPPGLPTREGLDISGSWDNPFVSMVQGVGWGNKDNPNRRGLGLVWEPSNQPRMLGLLPGMAPGFFAIDTVSGVFGSCAQSFPAIRDGCTRQFFSLMAAAVTTQGGTLDLGDVLVVCVPGARSGVFVSDEERRLLLHIGDDDQPVKPGNTLFEWALHLDGSCQDPDQRWWLNFGRLGYDLLVDPREGVEVHNTRLNPNNVFGDTRCMLNDPVLATPDDDPNEPSCFAGLVVQRR